MTNKFDHCFVQIFYWLLNAWLLPGLSEGSINKSNRI